MEFGAGTQGSNLETEIEVGAMEEHCLLACSLNLSSATWLILLRTAYTELAMSTVVGPFYINHL